MQAVVATAHVGAGEGRAGRQAADFSGTPLRALPGNELPARGERPRLLTRQPRATKENESFFSSVPDSSLEELIYSCVCSLKDIIYWLIVVITKC